MSQVGNLPTNGAHSKDVQQSTSPLINSGPSSPTNYRRPSTFANRIPFRRKITGGFDSTNIGGITDEDEKLLKQLDRAEDSSEWLNSSLLSRSTKDDENTNSTPKLILNNNGKGNVNSLLKLDSQLAHLSTLLSIARQDTLTRMDATMATVTESIPKLGLELRLMRDAATGLRTNIGQVRERAEAENIIENSAIAKDDNGKNEGANAVLERLASLSALYERMTAARDVLSLAESWSTLSTDVTAYLADAKYEVAAARLAKAKSSLSVFERTPEYESRKKLLDGLASNMESRMMPTLVDAIRDRDVEQAKKLYEVFAIVDRKDQFALIWRKTRMEACLGIWSKAVIDGHSQANSFFSIYQRFFDSLLDLLEEERKIVGQVLPNSPRDNIAKLIVSILDNLDPEMSNTFETLIDRGQSTAVLQAVQLHDLLRKAAVGIAERIGKADVAATTITIDQAPSPSISSKITLSNNKSNSQSNVGVPTSPDLRSKRRASIRRMSSITVPKPALNGSEQSSIDTGLSPNTLIVPEKPSHWETILTAIPLAEEWEEKLFVPVLEFQLNYESIERTNIAEKIKSHDYHNKSIDREFNSKMQIGKDFANALKSNVEDALKEANLAVERTRRLTYGLSSDGLISCIDDILSSLIYHSKELLDRQTSKALEAAQMYARERIEEREKKEEDTFGIGLSSSSSSDGVEWKAFEEGMTLLSSMRNILDLIKSLESTIAERFSFLIDLFLPTAGTNLPEIVKGVCTDENGTCTAIFRLLLIASADRLRSGSLINMLKRMKSLLVKSSRTQPSQTVALFRSTRLALLEQTRSVQRHLTNMILSPLMPHLELYANLPIWSANRLPGSVNEYDLTMPTFSLSPTEDMSRIGEALLDLPRLLEVWSELPQFQWSVQGLSYVPTSSNDIVGSDVKLDTPIAIDQDITDPFELPSASMSPKRDKRLSLHGGSSSANSATAISPSQERRAVSGSHRHTPSVASIATLPAGGEQKRRQQEKSASNIPNQDGGVAIAQSALQSYLTSISLTLVSHLVSLVLPSIAKLTAAGASQLAADLDYLLTILSALNVTTASTAVQQEIDQEKKNVTESELSLQLSPSEGGDEVTLLIRNLEAWRDICKIKDLDGRRLRHLVRTGQVARGGSLGEPVEGFDGDEDKLRSLLGTYAFDMVARMRGW